MRKNENGVSAPRKSRRVGGPPYLQRSRSGRRGRPPRLPARPPPPPPPTVARRPPPPRPGGGAAAPAATPTNGKTEATESDPSLLLTPFPSLPSVKNLTAYFFFGGANSDRSQSSIRVFS